MAASDLIREARRQYDVYALDALPQALQRNSLYYHYLCLYPSLGEMQPIERLADYPPYPEAIHHAYIHVPFCSGVCDFCSYYLLTLNRRHGERIAAYLELVQQELLYHARHTRLDITYLFIGGGTPSLIPPAALDRFLSFIGERGFLNPELIGTVELHPEFFRDEARARQFLTVLKASGLQRVSIGYQFADDALLSATHRRHTTGFLDRSVALLREQGFLVNLDLMYGLPGQSLASWEATLSTAMASTPDSIATYFLFVSPGTPLAQQVANGKATLPDHRHIQTQHLMAQLSLQAAGYFELPNDFYARDVVDPESFRQEQLPSQAKMLPIGPGAYGFYSQTQMANVFDLATYERLIASVRSPLWRGARLGPAESIRRDLMFSLKNDPFVDRDLVKVQYGMDLVSAFPAEVAFLAERDLLTIEPDRISLTAKGRLLVEEIGQVFRRPHPDSDRLSWNGEAHLLEKHTFAPAYPRLDLSGAIATGEGAERDESRLDVAGHMR